MQPQDTVLIPLRARDGSVRAHTIVDAADAEWVNQWTWRMDGGYAKRTIRRDGVKIRFALHNELMGVNPSKNREVDHRDRNRLNNRRSNLRVATRAQNMQNKPSYTGASSQFRGVSWSNARRKWAVNIQVEGKQTFVGFFPDETQAAKVARMVRAQLMPFTVD